MLLQFKGFCYASDISSVSGLVQVKFKGSATLQMLPQFQGQTLLQLNSGPSDLLQKSL